MGDEERLERIHRMVKAIQPRAVRVVREPDDGTIVVPLVAADGVEVMVEVAVGVWADGLDQGDNDRAQAIAELLAAIPEDLPWLLAWVDEARAVATQALATTRD